MSTLFSKPKIPGKSAEQIEEEKHQSSELRRLKNEEAKRKAAIERGRAGRASLISGKETGIPTKDTLG